MKKGKQNKSLRCRGWWNCTKETRLPVLGDVLSVILCLSVGGLSLGCVCTHTLTPPPLNPAVFLDPDYFPKTFVVLRVNVAAFLLGLLEFGGGRRWGRAGSLGFWVVRTRRISTLRVLTSTTAPRPACRFHFHVWRAWKS